MKEPLTLFKFFPPNAMPVLEKILTFNQNNHTKDSIMNRIFSRIWNAHKGCWVACSEKARSCRKTGSVSHSQLHLLTTISIVFIPTAFALPTGGNITSGTGNIQVFDNGKQISINQSSDRIIINWDKFGIKADEKVRFNQPNQNSVALNRVLGLEGSIILGQLSGNGKVFIINPNGVVFGNGAQVNVGGLLVSTQNITDSDFNSGNYKFSGISRSTILNQGTINSANGSVILLANQVRNTGTINTANGSTVLAGGSAFTLSLDGTGLVNVKVDNAIMDALVQNTNKISANGGQVILTARDSSNLMKTVVNNSGTIEANTINYTSGKIVLDAGPKDRVDVNGQINASAQGQNIGDGGSINISGKHVRIGLGTLFNTTADNGYTGSVSIKADDFEIATRGNSVPYSDSYIASDTLSRGLGFSNFTITNGNGDLIVNGPVAWSSKNRLELNSQNNILINDNISSTGTNSSLAFNTGTGNYVLAKGKTITLSGPDTTFSINNKFYKVIQTFDQLQRVNSNLYGFYVIGNDIDGANKKFESIASGSNPYASFKGVLDGFGHTLTRLMINANGPNAGLIATNDGTLKNINLTAGSVSNTVSNVPAAIGSLIGYNRGTLVNSSSNVYVSSSYSQSNTLGGLVGINSGTINGGIFTGTVYSNSNTRGIGGITGENSRGTITNSTNTGTISGGMNNNAGSGNGAGGLVGINLQGTIRTSQNKGNVNVNYSPNSGGLVGINAGGIISDSSNTGTVGTNYSYYNNSYSANVGGLIGYSSNGDILNSRSDSIVNGGSYTVVGGLIGTNLGGSIINVAANSTVNNSYGRETGGLIGINNMGDVTDAIASGTVTGGSNSSVGGLIGSNNDGNVLNSLVKVTTPAGFISKVLAGSNTNIGGAIGSNTGTVTGVTAENNVVGGSSSNVGGLIGLNNSSQMEGTVSFSNSYGTVSGGNYSSTGGLIGLNQALASNSYSYSNVSSGLYSNIGGLVGLNETIGRVTQAQVYGVVKYTSYQTYGGAVGINKGSIEGTQVFGDAARLSLAGINRGIIKD